MDPNATLAAQIALARDIAVKMGKITETETLTDEEMADLLNNAEALAEAVLAMDGWLSRGGFLPRKWKNPNP